MSSIIANKQPIYKGKTKDVYQLDDGNILLKFKDTVTGWSKTGESDPGGNQVVGEVKGTGSYALGVTTYYFEILKNMKNIFGKPVVPTHFVSSNLNENEMTVVPVKMFGKGVEVVIRNIMVGSFVRRYGLYVKDGDVPSRPIIEFTLKDDQRDDPLINEDALQIIGLINQKQINQIKKYTYKLNSMLVNDLKNKGAQLYDIKFEFGLDNGRVVLIDEISGGNMRVFKDGKKLSYEELSKLILSK